MSGRSPIQGHDGHEERVDGSRGASTSAGAAFRQLGHAIATAWAAAGYRRSRFPGIVTEQLERHDIVGRIGPERVSDWILSADDLPRQDDAAAEFGHPPVNVFVSRHFYISVLYWQAGNTAIHEHGFCGAFQVLDGSSLHAEYEFVAERELNELVQLGDLRRRSLELCRRGTIRTIRSGSAGTHALVHLERPSATIVVRTNADQWSQPQYAYHPPGVRYDPFFGDPIVDRRLKLLDTLGWRTEAGSQALQRLMSSADPQIVMSVFIGMVRRSLSAELFQGALAPVREHDPAVAEALLAAYRWQLRDQRFLRAADLVSAPEHKFLMLLGALGPSSAEVESALRAYDPDCEPSEAYSRWTSEVSERLVRAPYSRWAPAVVRALLRGHDLAATVEEVRQTDPTVTDAELELVDQLYRRLGRTTVVGGLLAQAPESLGALS